MGTNPSARDKASWLMHGQQVADPSQPLRWRAHIRYREPEEREGRLCLLMELCDGGCVATLLPLYGPLRWNIVSRYPSRRPERQKAPSFL